MLSNICFNNFAQKSSPGRILALGLLLAVCGPGLGPDGPGRPETTESNPVCHAEQLLVYQLSQNIDPWGCPGSGPPGTCRRLPR